LYPPLAERLARVVNDCGSAVMRYADAGYELIIAIVKKRGPGR
jgi:urocanate hydratase